MPRSVLGRTAAVMLTAFATLAVLVRVGIQVPGDDLVVGPSSGDGRRAFALRVDALTGYAGAAGLTLPAVLLLLRLGRRRDAARCAASVAATVAGTTLLKHLVGRPRPELLSPSVAVSQFSFPSGHAAVTAALAVALLLAVRGPRARVGAAVAGTLLVLAAAAAQLLLALHHPSDIVGGWLWAAAVTTGVWAACDRGSEARRPAPSPRSDHGPPRPVR